MVRISDGEMVICMDIMNENSVVLDWYNKNKSVGQTSKVTGLSTTKIRKILISEGILQNRTSKEIQEIKERHPDWDNNRIARELHLSKQTVSMYLPYEKRYSQSDELRSNEIVIDSGQCGENVSWTLTKEGKLRIYGSGDMWDYSDEHYKKRKTLRPKWWHREDDIYVRDIIIEDGITGIGSSAFYDLTQLRSISLSNTIKTINDGAFAGLNYIEEIHVPENVSVINADLFYLCIYLERIYMPAEITEIKRCAFRACANLKDIYFPGPPPENVNYTAFSMCREDMVIHYKEDAKGWTDKWCGYDTEVW